MMRSNIKVFSFFVFILMLSNFSSNGFTIDKNNLIVNIQNAKPGNGNIVAKLYNSSSNYLNSSFKEIVVNKVVSNNFKIKFTDIAPGVYSVLIFQDENGNGKLDKNFIGLPKENYGFSRNERSTLGLPGWEKTIFEFKHEDKQINISIK